MGFASGSTIVGTWIVVCMAALFMVSCGQDTGGGDQGSLDTSVETDGIDMDSSGDALEPPQTVIEEDFRLLATRHPTLKATEVQTVLMDPRDPEWARPVQSLDQALASHELDCKQGCLVDRGFRWLAVTRPGVSGSGDVSLGRLVHSDTDLVVKLLEIDPLQNVRHLQFHGSTLYWSRKRSDCEATAGPDKQCWDFLRMALDNPGSASLLFSFPTREILATSQATGYFTLGEDGKTLILQSPTTNSIAFWVARDDGTGTYTLSRVGEPICYQIDQIDENGRCQGSGDFSDREPAAVSPDGKSLVATVIENDRRLVMLHFDLAGAGTSLDSRKPARLTLMEVPDPELDYSGKGYRSVACYNRKDKYWRFTRVLSPMRFSPDGVELLFVGHTDCKFDFQDPTNKAWTNLATLPLKTIADGNAKAEDIRFVTDFPEGYKAANVSIQNLTMDLSPSGDYVVFVGTPVLDSNGVILDTQDKHVTDLEIWATRRDGSTHPSQITRDDPVDFWKYLSVRVAAPSD